ncbi:MAG: trypsin-like peptidase domain-containing protein [Chloracidobacterium sp.]|nr:trypsin-like peptidase domain-containing protein [Chloracidobacterium sp.]
MEKNRFTDSTTNRGQIWRILTPALALGFGLFVSNGSMVFGQQAPEGSTVSSQQTEKSADSIQQAPMEKKVSEGVAQQKQLASPADLSRVFIDVAKRVKPAVVQINIVTAGSQLSDNDESNNLNPSNPPSEKSSDTPASKPLNPVLQREQTPDSKRETGSGVIVTSDGYILTNNHVAGPASQIRVRLYDGRDFAGRRIGVDPETDLALVKIDAQNLPYATLGDSSKLEQGEWVIALGSPFGLEQTMTAGIISATGRSFGGTYDNYLQTDASINPGNSGGPLINMNGEVIGINTMIYSHSGGSEGIGFSIPSNMAKKVKDALIRNGRVSRGYLGVNLQDVEGSEGGALITDVTDGGPASKAGLIKGDMIVEFDGKQVKSTKQLTEIIADTQVGKTLNVKYVHDGREQFTPITLAERPARSAASGDKKAPAQRSPRAPQRRQPQP